MLFCFRHKCFSGKRVTERNETFSKRACNCLQQINLSRALRRGGRGAKERKSCKKIIKDAARSKSVHFPQRILQVGGDR